jgi:hypothetical protein
MQMAAWWPTILTEIIRCSAQSLQENERIVPQMKLLFTNQSHYHLMLTGWVTNSIIVWNINIHEDYGHLGRAEWPECQCLQSGRVYWGSGGTCLHFWSRTFLRNVSNHLWDYKAQILRRL